MTVSFEAMIDDVSDVLADRQQHELRRARTGLMNPKLAARRVDVMTAVLDHLIEVGLAGGEITESKARSVRGRHGIEDTNGSGKDRTLAGSASHRRRSLHPGD